MIHRRIFLLGFERATEKSSSGFFVEPPAAIQADQIVALGNDLGNLLALWTMKREQDFVGHGSSLADPEIRVGLIRSDQALPNLAQGTEEHGEWVLRVIPPIRIQANQDEASELRVDCGRPSTISKPEAAGGLG